MSSLKRQTAVYGLATILNRGVGVLLIPLYTRFLSVPDYGQLNLFLLTIQGTAFLSLLGTNQTTMRAYYDFGRDSGVDERASLFTTSLAIILLWAPVAMGLAGITVLVFWKDGAVLGMGAVALAIAIGIGPLSALMMLFSGLMRVRGNARSFLAYNTGFFAVQAAMIAAALVTLRAGLDGVFVAQGLAYLFFGLVGLLALRRAGRGGRFSWPISRSLLSHGLPFAAFSLLVWVENSSVRVAIEEVVDLHSVGIFALAAQFAGILSLIGTALNYGILPHFYREAARPDATRYLGALVAKYIGLFGVCALGVAGFSPLVIGWIAAAEYFPAAAYVPALTVGTLLAVAANPVTWALTQAKLNGKLTGIQIQFVLMLLACLALFVGVLNLGIWGAVWASIVAGIVRIVIGYRAAKQVVDLQIPWDRLGKVGVILLAGCVGMFGAPTIVSSVAGVFVRVILFVVVAFFAFRVVGLGNLWDFLGIRGTSAGGRKGGTS